MEQKYEFTILPGIGPGEIKSSGTLADLLDSVPYLFSLGFVPPLHIINNILLNGIVDCGMSGGSQWEPFKLSLTQYNDLCARLAKDRGLKRDVTLDEIADHEDWVTATIRKHHPHIHL